MGFNITRPNTPPTPVRTFEGGQGFKQDCFMELYRTLNTALLTGDQFYESKNDKVNRIRGLIKECLKKPGGEYFLAGLAVYARDEMHLRSSPTVLVTELFLNRALTAAWPTAHAVWQRGDEPLEGLAYLKAMGEVRPKPYLRALAAWLNKLSVYNLIKYSSKGKSFTMRDALRLSHPMPRDVRQSAAFKYITQGYDKLTPAELELLPEVSKIREGDGLTWEQHISGKGSTKETWEAAIDKMGYMALLRNLRNLVEKDVSKATIERVASILSDPDQVARSKQFPFRFWNAYEALKAVPGNSYAKDVFGKTLRMALTHSARNVPELSGETLILVDRSASMDSPISISRGQQTPGLWRSTVGAIMGAIVSIKAQGQTWVFGTYTKQAVFGPGDDVITRVEKSGNNGVDHGTEIGRSLDTAYHANPKGYRRAIIFTDMQSRDDTWDVVKRIQQVNPTFSCYVVDLCGYEVSCLPKKAGCYQLSGFSDKLFNWISEEEATSGAIADKLVKLGQEVVAGTYRRGQQRPVVEESEDSTD